MSTECARSTASTQSWKPPPTPPPGPRPSPTSPTAKSSECSKCIRPVFYVHLATESAIHVCIYMYTCLQYIYNTVCLILEKIIFFAVSSLYKKSCNNICPFRTNAIQSEP